MFFKINACVAQRLAEYCERVESVLYVNALRIVDGMDGYLCMVVLYQ